MVLPVGCTVASSAAGPVQPNAAVIVRHVSVADGETVASDTLLATGSSPSAVVVSNGATSPATRPSVLRLRTWLAPVAASGTPAEPTSLLDTKLNVTPATRCALLA